MQLVIYKTPELKLVEKVERGITGLVSFIPRYSTMPRVTSSIFRVFPHYVEQTHTRPFNHPSGGPCHPFSHLLRFFCMSVGDVVAVGNGNTVSDTVRSILEALDGRLLLVRINVELDEQEEVAGQNTTSKQGSRLSAGAVPNIRPIPVASGEARVGAEVDREEIDDELSDLHGGQIFLPPYLLATSGCIVVIIHQNVNGEVEGDDDPGDAGAAVELGKAQESSDSVVVYMEEGKRFLLQYEENGVEELEVLEVVVDDVIEF